jgi:hypothetical protein
LSKCLFIVQWRFCLSILLVNILCFNQSNTFCYSSSPYILCCWTVFSMFCVSCSYTDVIYFNIIHVLTFFSFPPPLVSSGSPSSGNVLYIFICVYNACTWIYLPQESMWPLSFWTWLTSLKMMLSSSILLPENEKISFLFMA